jgi:hypothetical protein
MSPRIELPTWRVNFRYGDIFHLPPEVVFVDVGRDAYIRHACRLRWHFVLNGLVVVISSKKKRST